jgi:hypothetical protein
MDEEYGVTYMSLFSSVLSTLTRLGLTTCTTPPLALADRRSRVSPKPYKTRSELMISDIFRVPWAWH